MWVKLWWLFETLPCIRLNFCICSWISICFITDETCYQIKFVLNNIHASLCSCNTVAISSINNFINSEKCLWILYTFTLTQVIIGLAEIWLRIQTCVFPSFFRSKGDRPRALSWRGGARSRQDQVNYFRLDWHCPRRGNDRVGTSASPYRRRNEPILGVCWKGEARRQTGLVVFTIFLVQNLRCPWTC